MIYLGQKFKRFMDRIEGSEPSGQLRLECELEDAISDTVSMAHKSSEIETQVYGTFIEDLLGDEPSLIELDLFIKPLLTNDQYDPNSLSRGFRRENPIGPA